MVNRGTVEKQLRQIGCDFRFWGRSELAELPRALMEGENVMQCVNGRYKGGFALLCATDHRVLLIDKKPMNYLNLQDIRFEMISEFNYQHRLLDASACISTPTETLVFVSWNQHRLRALLAYIQRRVVEIRQYHYLAQQFQQMAIQQLAQQSGTPTYVPNLAAQAGTMPSITDPANQGLDSVVSTLGAFTYSKLSHFRIHSSRRLGRYATDLHEIYPPQRA